jgi:glycerol-3-phosphate acyltransferase PlsY
VNLILGLIAALAGYLLGSISSVRLIFQLAAPQTDLETISLEFPGTDTTFESDSVSATAARLQLGTQYGCLTAVLDMVKVALPTLIAVLWQPDEPYYLIVAGAGVVGHAWPIYHRFHGGRGESPILGGLLVIDAPGLLITTICGWGLSWLTGNLLVLRWGFLFLLLPWFWFRFHDLALVLYMIFVQSIFWIAMRSEIKQYFELIKHEHAPTQEDMSRFWGMGGSVGRSLDRYSLPGIIKHWRG